MADNKQEAETPHKMQQVYSLHESLLYIQGNLKAPKDKENTFGGYKYRSCESILNALKPLLQKTNTTLVLSDEIVHIGDRFYLKATATLSDGTDASIVTSALAREDLAKKGMDGAQLTGATSSYARKYALNAMFAIDDSVDSDMTNKHKDDDASLEEQALHEINLAQSKDALRSIYDKYVELCPKFGSKNSTIYKAIVKRGNEFN